MSALRPLLLLPLLTLSVACSGGKDDGYTFTDSNDAARALDVATGPVALYLGVALLAAFSSGDCPTISESDVSYELVGDGCTDSNGVVWDGVFRIVYGSTASAVVFDGFSIDDGQEVLSADGELTLVGAVDALAGVTTSRLSLTSGSFSADYTRYALSGDVAEVLFGGIGNMTAEGDVTLDGGATTFSGALAEEGACADENDAGTLTFEGSNVLTLTFDGATSCDGCVPWSTDDGAEGSLCEDSDSDTAR